MILVKDPQYGTGYYPTAYELAALSNDVYQDADTAPLPAGWSLFTASPVNQSYYGAMYLKEMNGIYVSAVFAHRGTMPNVNNLINDLEIALGEIPSIVLTAGNFTDAAIKEFNTVVPAYMIAKDITVITTGHSLGGLIADCSFIYNEFTECKENARSVTFENPGSWPAVKQLIIDMDDALPTENDLLKFYGILQAQFDVFLNDPNIINTCNMQTGLVHRLKGIPYDFWNDNHIDEPNLKIDKNVLFNAYFVKTFSFNDRHKMFKILDYLAKQGVVEFDLNPIGWQAGYINYLDYDKNKDYWDGYFQFVWNYLEIVRDHYEGDYEKYLSERVMYLRQTHLDAINVNNLSNIKIEKQISNDVPVSSLSLFKVAKQTHEFVLIDNNKEEKRSNCFLM